MRASSPSRALSLPSAVAVVVALVVAAQTVVPVIAPLRASAAAPTTSQSDPDPLPVGGREPPEDPTDAPPPAPISPEAVTTGSEPPPPTTPTLGKPLHDAPRPGTRNQPAIVAPANNVSPLSPTAGMGGRMMSTTDPEARRAKAELEGTSLDKDARADVPKRLPPLQRRAWWSMFGAFALGSAAGVFAGLAEVQEDKAERLAITLDSMTGSALIYSDVQSEYEQILRVGRRDAAVAKGLIAGASGFLVAGVVLFIVQAVKTRKANASRPNSRPRPTPATTPATTPEARVGLARGGLEVRF